MNYYLFPDSATRQAVDDYLYNREVLPITLQDRDPAIYQGKGKKLRAEPE